MSLGAVIGRRSHRLRGARKRGPCPRETPESPFESLPPGVPLRASEKASYRFDSPVDGEVTVRLTPHGGDLDLAIVGSGVTRGCEPVNRCLAASVNVGNDLLEEATVSVQTDVTIYFVVDGTGGGFGYTLEVLCDRTLP